jgi:MFS family permease
VFGTLLAAATVAMLIGNEAVNARIASAGWDPWRIGFAIGVLPALLTLWIRWKLHEPESWTRAQQRAAEDPSQKPGRLGDLFSSENLRSTIVGVTLATIGLVTFWGIHIYGKNALLRRAQQDALKVEEVVNPGADATSAESEKFQLEKAEALKKHAGEIKRNEMLSMTLNTIGGGLGLLFFGAISNRLGRRGAFILYHVVAFAAVILLFGWMLPNDSSPLLLACFLPVFGFFTLGMHAGYAVYFPELYPTRLRGTGAGFCFNMGRLGTAVAFFVFGFWILISPESQALWLSPLYLVGAVVVTFGRETRGEELLE